MPGDGYLFCGSRVLPPHQAEVTSEWLYWVPVQFVFSLNRGRRCLPCSLLGTRGLYSASGILAQQVGVLFLGCGPLLH